MKVIILAGGRGTRLSEETYKRPKPMVKVGDYPLLWHLMKYYSGHGFNDFIICVGYLGYQIKEYFSNYALHNAECLDIDVSSGFIKVKKAHPEKWRVQILETGLDTGTSKRIHKALELIPPKESFIISYGDVIADVDLKKLLALHKSSNMIVTVSAGYPPAKYGSLDYNQNEDSEYVKANSFAEKPNRQMGLVSCGFFVCDPETRNFINSDDESWEDGPLPRICSNGKLGIYKHLGFWQPMDTARDKQVLEDIWNKDEHDAPWRNW